MLLDILVHTIIISHRSGILAAALDVCPHAFSHDTESFLSCFLPLLSSFAPLLSISLSLCNQTEARSSWLEVQWVVKAAVDQTLSACVIGWGSSFTCLWEALRGSCDWWRDSADKLRLERTLLRLGCRPLRGCASISTRTSILVPSLRPHMATIPVYLTQSINRKTQYTAKIISIQ